MATKFRTYSPEPVHVFRVRPCVDENPRRAVRCMTDWGCFDPLPPPQVMLHAPRLHRKVLVAELLRIPALQAENGMRRVLCATRLDASYGRAWGRVSAYMDTAAERFGSDEACVPTAVLNRARQGDRDFWAVGLLTMAPLLKRRQGGRPPD